jgi:arylsulfatase A-like enzyme
MNPHTEWPASPDSNHRSSFAADLKQHAAIGSLAFSILALIELIDANVQLTNVFASTGERLVFSLYLLITILTGLVIGALVGAAVWLGSLAVRLLLRLFGSAERPAVFARLAAYTVACVGTAILLNWQPGIHRFALGFVREGEKISFLSSPLLNHERLASFGAVMLLVAGCSLLWLITARAKNGGIAGRIWATVLVLLLGAVYFVDSRVEVQLYEDSLHVALFIAATALAMSMSSLLLYPARNRSGPPARVARWAMLVGLIGGAVTFIHLGSNQNLKTQVFFRAVYAKQSIKLAQWALDFDRDGYSGLLDGGDADDRNASINPGAIEVAGDGIDNNCIGGDLVEGQVTDWLAERSALNEIPAAGARRLNVIYIFIDALRADHLGVYGYPRATSPNIDKLAARASVFENAFTPAPNTFEAMPKFMQSAYWDGHYESWPEMLAANGYNNILFPRRIATQLRHIRGMKVAKQGRAGTLDRTIDAAIELLGSAPGDQPFCAYLYSTDPHRPYLTHEGFDFGASLVDRYDGEIAFADSQFGRLFDWLEQTGRLENTMILIMADHGESLGERGVYKHSSQLYNEQARVPMIIYVPGMAPRRVHDYVSTIDLGATILQSVGIKPPKEYAGVGLAHLIRGEAFVHPPVFAEQTANQDSPFVRPEQQAHPHRKKYMVVTQDGFKLIYNRDAHCFELFNLRDDPAELHNLYDRLPQKALELKQLLGRYIDVVQVSRPADADETQYLRPGTGRDDDSK